MALFSVRKTSMTRRHHASASVGILALALGSTVISALPAQAGTTGTSVSTQANKTAGTIDSRYAALAAASSSGQPVTVDSLTTADSQTEALPDGTFSTTTTQQPTRMPDSTGSWVNIDPTLERDADGSISTTATPNTLTLSGGGAGPVITAADPIGHFLALSLPTTMPAPTLNGASATYPDIYPGISLTVTAAPTGGFSEVFAVANAAAEAQAQNLTFTTQLSGLTLNQASDGSMTVADPSTGQTVMSAPPAVMWDSSTSGAPAAGVPDEFENVTAATSSAAGPGTDAHTGVLPITAGSGTLAMQGSTSHLDTASPTYPLYLDPTWVEPYQSGGTAAYDEVEGASACQGYQNYNKVTQPGVGDVTTNTDCPGAYETYYQINTSNVLNSTYDIKSATLKINEVYSALNSCGQGSESITIYTTGGIGSGTDWSNKPAFGQKITTKSLESDGNSAGTECSGGVVAGDFDVSSGITQVRANNWSTWTFAMVGNETNGSNSLERFNNNPSITTVYDIKPDTPTNLAATPAPVDSTGAVNQDCGGTSPGYLGIANLAGQHLETLSAKLTSAVAAAQMQGVFTLDDATAGTTVGNYTSSGYVTSGATVSVQTPALTDGHQYAWSLYSTDQYDGSLRTATCRFIVDETPPNNPAAASTDFPVLGSSTATGKRYGQSGNNSGTITLTSSDPSPSGGTASGLRGFYYSLDEPATTGSSFVAAGSGSANVTITPTHWGTNTLYVLAVDNAGNLSADTTYSYYLPWYPAAATAGDVDGDGIPDLLTTTPSGSLVDYSGANPTTIAPTTLSTAGQSPSGTNPTTPWNDYQISHDGDFTQQGADDLWAFNPTTHHLYLYKNNGNGTSFANPANAIDIKKSDAATDSKYSVAGNSTGATACFATAAFPNACASGSYDNDDWGDTSQVISSPDLYALSSDSGALSSDLPGLLTVESDALWYYQGGASPDYIGTAVELSASGWSAQTVLSPVTVDGNLVLWARNTTTGVLSQYPVDYGTDGYPYLGSATQLTVPGSPSLTAANYPGIYSLELGSTSATPYPDLVTQDANGQDLYYPGAAPAGSLAAFTVAQPLGQPADALTASYQDGSGAVHTYTAAGVTSPGIVTTAGSSPSTVALPAGGYATAFRSTDANGDLEVYNSATGRITNTGEGVHASTSPSLAVSGAGVIQAAFQANNGILYTYNFSTAAVTNTGYAMESGTSPSLAATPAGDFRTVFQASNTNLWSYDLTSKTTVTTTYGMDTATSPAIAAADNGTFAAVFQANTNALWTLNPVTGAGVATTKGMMATSSPTIGADPEGVFEIAFEANTGYLFGWDYALDTSAYYGTTIPMNHTSNPSVTGESDGSFRVGIESGTDLYLYNPTSKTGSDTGQAMNAGTSPSLAQ